MKAPSGQPGRRFFCLITQKAKLIFLKHFPKHFKTNLSYNPIIKSNRRGNNQ